MLNLETLRTLEDEGECKAKTEEMAKGPLDCAAGSLAWIDFLIHREEA